MTETFDPAGLDEVIHGKLRLGVMAYLSAVDRATFAELKSKTGATDGNLSVHLSKLEEAGYVAVEKKFVGKRPQTSAKLTDAGRAAWLAYLDMMRRLFDAG